MNADTLTDDERELIEHSLGLSNAKRPYRTHYAAASGTKPYAICDALAERELMVRGETLSYGRFFHVTERGARAVGHSLPKD